MHVCADAAQPNGNIIGNIGGTACPSTNSPLVELDEVSEPSLTPPHDFQGLAELGGGQKTPRFFKRLDRATISPAPPPTAPNAKA